MQCWFNLSDEGVKDAIYDSYAMRKFMRLNCMKDYVPDATTLLHFRRIMEESELGKALFEAINRVLEENGNMMRGSFGYCLGLVCARSPFYLCIPSPMQQKGRLFQM